MKGVIEKVFTAVFEVLVEEGYVILENYFMKVSFRTPFFRSFTWIIACRGNPVRQEFSFYAQR